MRGAATMLVAAVLAGPAHGRATSALVCGVLKAETWQVPSDKGQVAHWSISRASEKVTETGMLRSGPRFECLDNAVLVVEFTSSLGHSVFDAYFPDGTNIGYARQQIDRRGGRFVLPVQAKVRIAPALREAFDYHCRFDLPADPIVPASRADCVF